MVGRAWVGILQEFSFRFFIYYTNCLIQIHTTQFVLYKLYTNCIVRICTCCGFCTKSYNCYTNSIVQIRTRCGFCTNSYNFYTNCIVQIHTKYDFYFFLSLCKRAASAQREPRGRSPSCERAARAARAKPEHTSCHDQAAPGCPTIRVHPAAPTS